ncbi:MAG: DUF1553 domain-containing protein [Rhodothermales bacterium]|nr:DUF1553 domain-containing protein [Rhodothermales bacterium]MBO6778700.1 DUF1553 domain-containing protein [Rhodothermales bacterium]
MKRAAPIVLLLLVACAAPVPEDVSREIALLPERVDFNFHVKPVLSDRCFKCHGPDANTRVEDIRFDTPRGIRASRKHIARRILAEDPEVRMPPPESNLTLSARDKAVLLRWVDQGAPYADHWAHETPVRPVVPVPARAAGLSAGSEWPAQPIDRFLRAAQEQRGLEPAPPAAPETWLRRVHFVLTGLPPSPSAVESFMAGEETREEVVDALFASPAYGERMAVDWLDLARYADSHGYQDDGWRNMWPWRDWVISAFNRNMPYDQFVTWQLAGDLLPEPTREQLLATGFNRNHLQSQEGGIVLEEYRVDYVADRTNTFGKAFLGLTAECARCHDHKYDPMSQEEYFGLFAFFNSVNEVGNIPYAGEASPTVVLTDSLTEAELAGLREEIAELEGLVDPSHARWDLGFSRWDAPGRLEPVGLIGHFPLDGFELVDDIYRLEDRASDETAYFWGDTDKLPHVVAGVVDSALVLRGDGWLDTGNQRFRFDWQDPFSIEVQVKRLSHNAIGPLMGKSGGLMNGNRGYMMYIDPDGRLRAGLFHVAPDNGLEVVSRDTVGTGDWERITMTWDGSGTADGLRLYRNGLLMETDVLVDRLEQSIAYTVDPFTQDSTNWGDPGNLRLGFTETNQPMLKEAALDEFRVWDRALTAGEISGHPPSAEEARAFFVTVYGEDYPELHARLTALRARKNRLLTHTPSTMVMRERNAPRQTHLLNRGAYDEPRQRVEHATPLVPYPDDAPRNRLGLAEWLFQPDHPLTARVAVNRLWQQVFGIGLVSTSDNFGSQGALPSHPELLDWLAVEFQESGWDIQHMLRLMLLSETFAQSSLGDTAEDSDNTWLARAPVRRLSAEMMRDQALAASGLLVRDIGGPPVRPYQPEGLWAQLATRNAVRYEADSGEKLYRRSLYTIWKRTVPPPMMLTFDATERNLCTVQRQSTSTPLQALVLMNDPQFVEAARVLGEKLVREYDEPIARVRHGFLALTGRPPSTEEQDALLTLATEQAAAYARSPRDARALLEVGEYPRDRSLRPSEAATWAVVASTIMNFDGATTLR